LRPVLPSRWMYCSLSVGTPNCNNDGSKL
jgi:hypothetical protein